MSGCAGVSSVRLGVAFACVIGAGLAAVLGALFVLFVPIKNDLFLAASLSFAAGVMTYVSIVDIYAGKSVGHFEDAGYSPAHAFTYASLCFFGGFPISYVLDKVSGYAVYRGSQKTGQPGKPTGPPSSPAGPGSQADSSSSDQTANVVVVLEHSGKNAVATPRAQPVAEASHANGHADDGSAAASKIAERGRRLVHMGLLAAMAMALHNMPEGLVTFVGYMDSIASGITTAIAIAVHNVPEGMVIASAVYFGTGQRWKALLWTSVASVAEPLGGLIGLAVVCGGSLTDTVFGILFGLVAGIMVYISLKELLPSSRQFDPHDRVSTVCMMVGMALMACSLVAIGFSQAEPQAEAVSDVAAVLGADEAGGNLAEGP